MSKEKDRKTNAIREMEAAHADFDTRFFESPEALPESRWRHYWNKIQIAYLKRWSLRENQVNISCS